MATRLLFTVTLMIRLLFTVTLMVQFCHVSTSQLRSSSKARNNLQWRRGGAWGLGVGGLG